MLNQCVIICCFYLLFTLPEIQKQPFADVAQKSCSLKLRNIYRKHLCCSLFFNKVASLRPTTLLKKRLQHWCFRRNFAKILRTPFSIEQYRWLLLDTEMSSSLKEISSTQIFLPLKKLRHCQLFPSCPSAKKNLNIIFPSPSLAWVGNIVIYYVIKA